MHTLYCIDLEISRMLDHTHQALRFLPLLKEDALLDFNLDFGQIIHDTGVVYGIKVTTVVTQRWHNWIAATAVS